MSNALAVAAMMGVLEARVAGLLVDSLAGFDTFIDHPRGDDPSAGVYLKPYRIAANPSLANTDLPTRRADGTLVKRPRLAIDVDVMFSFVGQGSTFDAERLAGLVMTSLHADARLTAQEIGAFMAGLPGGHVLAEADLGDQLERVKLVPLGLSLEDLSRLWGMTGQSQYPLTVAYRASAILLEPEVDTVTALPVTQAPGIFVTPTAAPRLVEVRSSARRQPLVATGEALVLIGGSLRGRVTQVEIGEHTLDVPDADARPARVAVTIPDTVPAGVAPVRVVHRVDVGAPGDPLRNAGESNALPVAIVPTVGLASPNATAVPEGIEVRLTVVPIPDPAQDVTLLLDRVGGGEHVASTQWTLDGTTVVFTAAAPAAGDYLVRLRVDGASSIPSNNLDSPAVAVP